MNMYSVRSCESRTKKEEVISPFLGAFSKLRTVTISFVISVRPSVCPHATTWFTMDEFSWNLVLVYFRKTVVQIWISLKTDKN